MQQNYQTTKAPTVGSSAGGGKFGADPWQYPERITADDGSSAFWGAFAGGQGAAIAGSVFGFDLPAAAVIDGIEVNIKGSQTGCYGDVTLNIAGTSGKSIATLNTNYGGATDLWGASEITPADMAAIEVTADTTDVSGGDGIASMDYMTVTVYWHIDLATAPADVPTRVAYKAYSNDGEYLGDIPNVTSPLAFTQDMNSAGSSLEIVSGHSIDTTVSVEPLITGDEQIITTGNGLPILVSEAEQFIAKGSDTAKAIFKNANRVAVFIYNYWYPNGKLIFSGQVNRISYKHAAGTSGVRLMVYSDGIDLANYIARGYPFIYTQDQTQTTTNVNTSVWQGSGKASGQWQRYGQSFKTGASANNIGAITVRLQGSANVTLSVYDGPNGLLLGNVTKAVNVGSPTNVQFAFPNLLPATPNTTYFFALSVAEGQSITIFHANTNPYANGAMYGSSYAGGSGGGSYGLVGTGDRDMYFITYYGTPTTTTTYSSQDPITGMVSGVLADYNARGGRITERDFTPAGYNLTVTLNMATIFDAHKKGLELAPAGYHSYIDLGTAEMDIMPTSETADFTVVKGNDVNELDLSLSIENVKNYLLFTGGEVSGSNLYRDYQDNDSMTRYGQRIATKTDNRVIQTATADAIGNTFIEENSEETQETSLTVLNSSMDITQLTPGKTIGFRNFGYFIDSMVLQIVRREFNVNSVTLTLGRLPVTMTAEIQRINRDLLNEQTANNPSAPS